MPGHGVPEYGASEHAVRWTVRGYLLAFCLVLAPVLPLAVFSDFRGVELVLAATRVEAQVFGPLAVLVAACLYTAWRVSPETCPAWILAMIAVLASRTVGVAALAALGQEDEPGQAWWVLLIDLVGVGAGLGFAAVQGHPWLRYAPAWWGGAIGIGLAGGHAIALDQPGEAPPAYALVLEMAASLGIMAALIWYLVRRSEGSRVLRTRLAAMGAALVVARAVQLAGADELIPAVVVLLAAATAALFLVEGGVRALQEAIDVEAGRRARLARSLELAEVERRMHQLRMHELRSAVSGVSAVNELLRRPGTVTGTRRPELETLVHAELGRLRRLLQRGRLATVADPEGQEASQVAGTEVDLDETIRMTVIAHRAQGTHVVWEPSGHRVRSRPDDVAGVLDILLENAARHGDGEVTLGVRAGRAVVELRVTDSGPGLAAEVRDRLFEFGGRIDGSPGQGIGLHLAHRLARRHGGYLAIDDDDSAGAGDGAGVTFVLGLPSADDHGADDGRVPARLAAVTSEPAAPSADIVADDHLFAAWLAEAAGARLLQVRAAAPGQGLEGKALKDAGDAAAHELLMRLVAEYKPDDAVLSEEGKDDKARLGADRVWIIDPLDGTREFSEPPRDDWAVHVALWQRTGDGVAAGDLTAGAVAQPELGETFTTGTPPQVPGSSAPRPRIAVSRSRPPAFVQALADELDAELVPMGSAGVKMMSVVRDVADAYVHAGGQYEWDSAAPVAVARAAGLFTSRVDGSDLVYNNDDVYLPDVIVCRPELSERILAFIAAHGTD